MNLNQFLSNTYMYLRIATKNRYGSRDRRTDHLIEKLRFKEDTCQLSINIMKGNTCKFYKQNLIPNIIF